MRIEASPFRKMNGFDGFLDDFGFDFDMGDFDPVVADGRLNDRYIKPKTPNVTKASAIKYRNAAKLARDIDLQQGDRVNVLVGGSFIFGDFIEALFVEKNIKAKRLTITTLSMSQDNVDSLRNLIVGGYVERLDLIVSAYFFSHYRNSLIKYLYEQLDIDNRFQLAVAAVHTKTCLIETEGGKHIVIEGSANLRSSQNIEAIVICDDKQVYDFHIEWQEVLLREYKTINTPIRAGKRTNELLNFK